MRILIVGTPKSPLADAAQIARTKGAPVFHAESRQQAMAMLRSGWGINVLLVGVGSDIRDIVFELEAEQMQVPIIACDIRNDVRAAVTAIHAGAKECISLPPDPDIIAAMLVAVADGTSDLVDSEEAVALVVEVAEQVRPSGAVARRTLADAERDLILETLRHCLGNRTHAAQILGISVRTLRNKLHEYAAGGLPVPRPHGGDQRGAARASSQSDTSQGSISFVRTA
jgi:two-component system, response regulator FlrC